MVKKSFDGKNVSRMSKNISLYGKKFSRASKKFPSMVKSFPAQVKCLPSRMNKGRNVSQGVDHGSGTFLVPIFPVIVTSSFVS